MIWQKIQSKIPAYREFDARYRGSYKSFIRPYKSFIRPTSTRRRGTMAIKKADEDDESCLGEVACELQIMQRCGAESDDEDGADQEEEDEEGESSEEESDAE